MQAGWGELMLGKGEIRCGEEEGEVGGHQFLEAAELYDGNPHKNIW